MPNHTANMLTVLTTEQELDEIKNFVKSSDSLFDFNRIIPMPKDLEITSGSIDMGYEAIYEGKASLFLSYSWIVSEGITTEQGVIDYFKAKPEYMEHAEKVRRNVEKYGYKNWYDFAVREWSTKWNAYGFEPGGWNDNQLYFETAWSPPENVILKLSELFPNAVFKLDYHDEGGCFLGTTEYKSGEIIHQEDIDEDSFEGMSLLLSLGRYYEPDEIDEDENLD